MKIITALGDSKINEELRKDNFFEVVGVDIQYQDGIFELLEENKNIDYLILNLNLIGDFDKYELIEKIEEINKNIKLIIILEKLNINLEKYLYSKKIKYIFYKNEININKIKNIVKNKKQIKNKKTIKNKFKKINDKKEIKINLINKKEKNKQKNKLEKNKTITIIGDKKSGKTIFTILISKLINKKILIITTPENKEINIMLGIKNNQEKLININNKIKLIKCEYEDLERGDVQKILKKYKYIIIDTSNMENIEKFKKITTNYFLIVEPNLIGINNSKKIINKIQEKEKIKIIINKNNIYSINKIILKFIFSSNKIIAKINQNNKFNFLINNNFKIINIKIKKEFLKLIKEVEENE